MTTASIPAGTIVAHWAHDKETVFLCFIHESLTADDLLREAKQAMQHYK